MLATLKEVLEDAKKNHYAVGCFNAIDLHMAKAVIQAAQKNHSPVIVGTAEVLLPYSTLEHVANMLIPMAESASVPVVLHYDHGYTESLIEEALELGFTSIMYDCSMDTFEENVKKVSKIRELCNKYNASLEAELGHVGSNDGADESVSLHDESVFTVPKEARSYVEKTQVDALAVAFGSAHGPYKQTPKLDLQRLEAIADTVDIPLVLHGGSGISDDDFKASIQKGICKINVFTDINHIYAKTIADHYNHNGITDVLPKAIEAMTEAVTEKMKLFGSINKA